jgi:hypothetical protein
MASVALERREQQQQRQGRTSQVQICNGSLKVMHLWKPFDLRACICKCVHTSSQRKMASRSTRHQSLSTILYEVVHVSQIDVNCDKAELSRTSIRVTMS